MKAIVRICESGRGGVTYTTLFKTSSLFGYQPVIIDVALTAILEYFLGDISHYVYTNINSYLSKILINRLCEANPLSSAAEESSRRDSDSCLEFDHGASECERGANLPSALCRPSSRVEHSTISDGDHGGQALQGE